MSTSVYSSKHSSMTMGAVTVIKTDIAFFSTAKI